MNSPCLIAQFSSLFCSQPCTLHTLSSSAFTCVVCSHQFACSSRTPYQSHLMFCRCLVPPCTRRCTEPTCLGRITLPLLCLPPAPIGRAAPCRLSTSHVQRIHFMPLHARTYSELHNECSAGVSPGATRARQRSAARLLQRVLPAAAVSLRLNTRQAARKSLIALGVLPDAPSPLQWLRAGGRVRHSAPTAAGASAWQQCLLCRGEGCAQDASGAWRGRRGPGLRGLSALSWLASQRHPSL